jgi:hypothetical protein
MLSYCRGANIRRMANEAEIASRVRGINKLPTHKAEGSSVCIFQLTGGVTLTAEKWAVRHSPHVLKATRECPLPTPAEAPAEKIDPRQWCRSMERIAHHCCRDLGTAGDVAVVLFRVQRIR